MTALAQLSFREAGPWQGYLGQVYGEPVAAMALYVSEDAVGVSLIGGVPGVTQPEMHGALTQAALYEARSSGTRLAVIRASRRDESFYQHLGFQRYGLFSLYGCQR